MITLHVRTDRGEVAALTADEILQTKFTGDDGPLLDVTIENCRNRKDREDSGLGTITVVCPRNIMHICPENMQTFEAAAVEKDSLPDVDTINKEEKQ